MNLCQVDSTSCVAVGDLRIVDGVGEGSSGSDFRISE